MSLIGDPAANPPPVRSVRPDPVSLAGRIVWRLRYVWERYVVCRGDTAAYLRRQGARIGQGCAIQNTIADFGSEPWLIRIGDRVTLTGGVKLLTHDGASRLFRDRIAGGSRYGNRFGPIVIGDNCFIGVNSIILPGVTIGPNSIVGVGSVVNRDVPPNTVVAGVPAKPLCTLDEYIERYREKMIPIAAEDRESLRRELTARFWGEAQ
jgi:acetyltransferase-like isoleucine patch superfamily enzyme